MDGPRFTYPLARNLTDRLVADRVCLIGDAGHGVHPIAGQGLNQSLRDVGALAEVLTEAARRGEDIGADGVLARYQRWRSFDTVTLAVATNIFNWLFSNDNSTLRATRDVGMDIVRRTPKLRGAFLREASGVAGDVPKLLRGEQI